MNNPVIITNILLGFLISVILIWSKIESHKQFNLIIEKLKENTASNLKKSVDIDQALKIIKQGHEDQLVQIREEMHNQVLELAAKFEAQNTLINFTYTFMNVRYAILLENEKNNKKKIAELTNDPIDIDAAEAAKRAYESHASAQKIALQNQS